MINIIPINDLKIHLEGSICNCNPQCIIENGELILIHNAYDKRN